MGERGKERFDAGSQLASFPTEANGNDNLANRVWTGPMRTQEADWPAFIIMKAIN